LARVEQCAEECSEEHHLGKNEPHHAHPERDVDLAVVMAAHRLADHVAEPAEQHADQQRDADEERRLAPAALVEPAAKPDHRDEQCDRTQERPAAAVRNEIDVGVWRGGVGHGDWFRT